MKMKLGDVVEIPLSNGLKAYGQYVYLDKKMGPLLQIYDRIVPEDINLEQIYNTKPLFPPIITGLFAAVKNGLWKVVGNLPIRGFKYPGYISTFYDEKTGKASTWHLWNGSEYIRIGDHLPEMYKNFEYLIIWSPYDVVERIETGEYPYPYKDLILHNKFKPEKS
jgi:hypothetical protein